MIEDLDYWIDKVEVHCNESDIEKIREGYMWCIEKAEWNSDNQRGEVILRKATRNDI